MSVFSTLFGVFFGIIWISIWVIAIVGIIKGIKRSGEVTRLTKDVREQMSSRLKDLNVHTGDPRNPYTRVYRPSQTAKRDEPATSDDFSEVVDRSNEASSFGSDLNPKSAPLRKSNRVKRTTKVNGFTGRKARKYSIDSSEMPTHGKLSQETRDDEKDWF